MMMMMMMMMMVITYLLCVYVWTSGRLHRPRSADVQQGRLLPHGDVDGARAAAAAARQGQHRRRLLQPHARAHPRLPGVLHLPGTTHTHTHPFNGPFSGTTRVSRCQKGKTNPDFTEARDSEWQWHPLGRMQVCISLQTDNHASTPPLSFLQAGCPSCRPTNSVKALKAQVLHCESKKNNIPNSCT